MRRVTDLVRRLLGVVFHPTRRIEFLRPDGVSNIKWGFMIHKRFFDTGYGMTGYIKTFAGLLSFTTFDVSIIFVTGLLYAVLCYEWGVIWHNYDFVTLDTEISNRFNLFVKEMRQANGSKTGLR